MLALWGRNQAIPQLPCDHRCWEGADRALEARVSPGKGSLPWGEAGSDCGQLSGTEPRQAVVTLRGSQVRGRLGGTAVAGTLGGKDGPLGMTGVQEMWSQIWRWKRTGSCQGRKCVAMTLRFKHHSQILGPLLFCSTAGCFEEVS